MPKPRQPSAAEAQAAQKADPDTVCELHLGLAQGAAEAVGGIVVDELVPHETRDGPIAVCAVG